MKKQRLFNNKTFLLHALLGIAGSIGSPCLAQLHNVMATSHSFLRENDNIVQNHVHLESFFEKLYMLKKGDKEQVNIIHFGDSHIQADFMTKEVRKNLQNEFGNAGRGFVFPYRIAGTNEPFGFKSMSSGSWEVKRMVNPAKPLPVGLGGITLSSTESDAGFSLVMTERDVDYRFNAISLFFGKDQRSMGFSFRDSLDREMAFILPDQQPEYKNFSKVAFGSMTNYFNLRLTKDQEIQTRATIFGLSMENGKRGILYHSIGVNGAKYEHYNKAELLADQTFYLRPDLFIISLGTNESVEYPVMKSVTREIDAFVQNLRKINPDALFILVTPPDAFVKKSRINPGIQIIREQIIQYAVENGMAFWDMYNVCGGKESAALWRERNLLRPDGIHFTREGYALQGDLLFKAIMKSYGKYVIDRHP